MTKRERIIEIVRKTTVTQIEKDVGQTYYRTEVMKAFGIDELTGDEKAFIDEARKVIARELREKGLQ